MWSEHCSYKSSRDPPEAPADRGAVGAGRSRRERRRRRRRRRHRRRHPHREPQPSVGHRAVPGRGHRRRRHPPRHLHDGRPADRRSWTRCASARSTTPAAAGSAEGVVSRHLRLRQLGRRAHRRRRGRLRRDLRRATRSSTCCASACCRPSGWCSAGPAGVGNLAVLLGSTTGRDGIGGVSVLASAGLRRRRGRRGQAPERAGRRPVRGEAPHRGVPRPARRRARRRHPGPRRRRASPCATSETAAKGGMGMDVDVDRRAPPRAGHGAVRGHDQREPGAHAGHRRARRPRRGARHLPTLGGARHGRRHGHRQPVACASSTASTATVLADVPAASLHEDAPLLRPPAHAPRRPRRRVGRRPGGARRRPTTAAADLLAHARRHRRGSGASTTTSCSSTPSRARAATPPCCA